MYLNEKEKEKVNSSTVTYYENQLKYIEDEEERIVSSFDHDIEQILGKPLLDYLIKNNIIKVKYINGKIVGDNFLRNFHYTDIPVDAKFTYQDGTSRTYRDYVKSKLKKYFSSGTNQYKPKMSGELSTNLIDKNIVKCYALASLALTQFHRKRGMVLRDVQKIAGLAMAYGDVAELGTGEGKTVAAVLPTYIHALRGKGVHVVTANSYLSSRDYEELKPVYEGLGLSVGYVPTTEEEPNRTKLRDRKKKAYACDITYSAKDEIAFDYLRDSRAQKIDEVVNRDTKPGFAIIDEVDDALVDSASSPYIIAGSPLVYAPNMTVENLADTLSLSLPVFLEQLERKGINADRTRKLSFKEASQIADLFAKELYLDNYENIVKAQIFYSSLKARSIVINPKDKEVFERNSHLFSMENGILRVNDKRLYELLASEELDKESSSYYGKYKLDINDVNTIRKYTNVVVCPTSGEFYVRVKCVEEHMLFQFLSSSKVVKATDNYRDLITSRLDKNEDYTINSDTKEIRLTTKGLLKIYDNSEYKELFKDITKPYEELLYNRNEYGGFYLNLLHKTITANELLKKGEDYTVRDGNVILLKNAREKEGSTYTDGLHQAIEVKEAIDSGAIPTKEHPSLASITQKDFYSRYELFSGMTGTSAKKIFDERYGKSTVEIPRDSFYKYYSKKLRREKKNTPDEPVGVLKKDPLFAKNIDDKHLLILKSIKESLSTDPKQPVLIVVSDPKEIRVLESFLRKNGINPNVLEATRLGKDKKKDEAKKVSMAGRPGMVTISTEMAGRGTDIMLGGDRDTLIEMATDTLMEKNKLDEKNRDNARIVVEEALMNRGLIPSKEKELVDREKLSHIGLKVISSGFFKSERIDRQLEGRTGRNGFSGVTERFSSPEDLIHFGLERIDGEPLEEFINRQQRRSDGSLAFNKNDNDRLIRRIRTIQDNYDNEVNESLKFAQDITHFTTGIMEDIRSKRRNLLELTKNEEKMLDNKTYIKEVVYKMIEDTVDNLIVSYIGNRDLLKNIDYVDDGDCKDLFKINYEGLRLAIFETLGIDIDIQFLQVSDVSLLEFRNALIKHAKKNHDEEMKKDEIGQLKKDVDAILLANDNSLSRVHEKEEEVKRQKAFDNKAYGESADMVAITHSFEEQKSLEFESRRKGIRMLLGSVLSPSDKEKLEIERKKMFDYRITSEDVYDPISKEDSYKKIELFRKKAIKTIKDAEDELDKADKRATRKLRKNNNVDISPFYSNLSIRPVVLVLGSDGRFTLRKDLPSKQDLLDSKKTLL